MTAHCNMALGKQRENPKSGITIPKQVPKYLVVLAAVAAILILLSLLVFCGSGKNPVRTTPVVDNYGHSLFIEECHGTTGIIHDPECEKCRKVIDDFMLKAIVHAFDTLEVKVIE